MRRSMTTVSALLVALAMCSGVAGATVSSAGHALTGRITWGTPTVLRGLAKLTLNADVESLACPSAGNCIVGGSYQYTGDPTFYSTAFVAIERDGTWGAVEGVPGLATLDGDAPSSGVGSIACADTGDCSVVGGYTDRGGTTQGYVADEVGGVWQPAIGIPSLSALATGGWAWPTSVSCGAAGQCTVGGAVETSPSKFMAFLADEVGGSWQAATPVPGLASLHASGLPAASQCQVPEAACSVDCPSAGNCSVLGSFVTAAGSDHSFAIDETAGTWGAPTVTSASPTILSCAAAGSCASVGPPTTASSDGLPDAVVDEVRGAWHSPQGIPRLARLDVGKAAQINSVACPAVGDCVVAGSYTRHVVKGTTGIGSDPNSFTASEVDGRWGSASPLPNSPAGANGMDLVACAAVGDCVAIGGPARYGLLVAVEQGGVWAAPRALPNSKALHGWSGEDAAMTCTTSGACTLTGQLNEVQGPADLAFVDTWQL